MSVLLLLKNIDVSDISCPVPATLVSRATFDIRFPCYIFGNKYFTKKFMKFKSRDISIMVRCFTLHLLNFCVTMSFPN